MDNSFKTMRRGLGFFFLTWLVAIIGYRSFGWSTLDAVYMTTITVFGVGFGEVHPLDNPPLRIFTMFVIIAGCSSAAWVVGGFVQMLAEGHLNRVLGARRMTKGIEQLSGHTLLCGFGRVGQQLARELMAHSHQFVIIDSDLVRLQEAESQGMLVMVGDCTEEDVLLRAGIERARYVASVLSDDAANVFLTLTVRGLNPNVHIIARAESPSTEKKLMRSGANRVVLPTAIGATKIANLIARPSAEELLMENVGREILNEQLDQLGLRLQEFPITEASRLIGQSISRVEATSRTGFLIIGVNRADGGLLRHPSPDTVIGDGDSIMVLGHGNQMASLAFKASARTGTIHRGMRD
jgi:voltage-gated potassium channel